MLFKNNDMMDRLLSFAVIISVFVESLEILKTLKLNRKTQILNFHTHISKLMVKFYSIQHISLVLHS